jgi:hypothetical protein
LFFSPPFSVGYAFHAYRRAQPKAVAGIGLVLAVAELVGLLTLLSASVYYNS